VVRDGGQLERAKTLADATLLLAVRVGDEVRIGHGHFLRAVMLRELEQPWEAILAYQAALRHLRAHDERTSVLQGLGFTFLALGDLEQAQAWAEKFERESATIQWDANAQGRAYWLKAAIAARRQAWQEAADLYEAAGERLGDQPVDAAMIAAERTRALLHLGRRYEAIAFARQQCHLVIPLEDVNPIAAAALADLIRAGSEGEQTLTLQVVNAVTEGLARARVPSARASDAS
jgi:tetratricopeptide (TPR) repeat protein